MNNQIGINEQPDNKQHTNKQMENTNIEKEIEQHIAEEFIEMVREWVDKDDDIKKKRAELKEITDEKKQLEQFILDYMEDNNLDMFEISDGKLRKNISKTKAALKHDLIQESLTKVFNNTEKAFNTTKLILDNRPVTERIRLKRTYNRKKKE